MVGTLPATDPPGSRALQAMTDNPVTWTGTNSCRGIDTSNTHASAIKTRRTEPDLSTAESSATDRPDRKHVAKNRQKMRLDASGQTTDFTVVRHHPARKNDCPLPIRSQARLRCMPLLCDYSAWASFVQAYRRRRIFGRPLLTSTSTRHSVSVEVEPWRNRESWLRAQRRQVCNSDH